MIKTNKAMKVRCFATILAIASLIACRQEVAPLVHTAPAALFSRGEESVTARVGEKVSFDVTIEAGDRLSLGWYVNDVLEASTPHFEYVFQKAGSYTVRFLARNGAGELSKTYQVNVSDVFSVHLSTKDSTLIKRTQLQTLKVRAIVDSGAEVAHEWKVDGKVESTEAYFNSFVLQEVRNYTVSYRGQNAVGSFSKEFTVEVEETQLTMRYSNTDQLINIAEGTVLSITAEAVYGGSGLVSSWTVGEDVVGTEATLNYKFTQAGEYVLSYHGKNAKGETAERSWTVSVYSLGHLLEDFEGASALGSWWTLGQNQPGIQLADNPDKSGINTSDKVMSDSVNGTNSTSGYFDLNLSTVAANKDYDLTQCNGIRFKIHLGKSNYWPRVEYSGTKYEPVKAPQHNNSWEVLEYRFPKNFETGKKLTFRPLYQKDGTNIPAGAVSDENPRIVYIDDIEFLGSNL